MNELDNDATAGWTEAINFLLIFVSSLLVLLFVLDSFSGRSILSDLDCVSPRAVRGITKMLAEMSEYRRSSNKLEPDHTEYSSRALFFLASISSGKNLTLPDDADPDKFRPKATHRTINALWFSSLTLSLIISMFAILAKQWISIFVSRMRMPVPDHRYWAHRHRLYRDGLDRWKITPFVSSLSIFLHLALLLFLTGLIIHSYELDLAVFVLVATLSGLALIIYAATTFAPLLDGACPTATPLLIHGRGIMRWIWTVFSTPDSSVAAPFDESRVVPNDVDNANVDIIAWIINNLRGEQEVDVALDAIAALPESRKSDTSAANQAPAVVTAESTPEPLPGTVPAHPGGEAHDNGLFPSRLRRLIGSRRSAEIEMNATARLATSIGLASPATGERAQGFRSPRLHRSRIGMQYDGSGANAGATSEPQSGGIPAQSGIETQNANPYISRLCRLTSVQRSAEMETTTAHRLATDSGPVSLATIERVKALLTSRLRRLVAGRRNDEIEENSRELARAVRSIMRLVVGAANLPEASDIQYVLLKVRTHDVAVLSAIMGIGGHEEKEITVERSEEAKWVGQTLALAASAARVSRDLCYASRLDRDI